MKYEREKQHNKGAIFIRKGFLLSFHIGPLSWLQLWIKYNGVTHSSSFKVNVILYTSTYFITSSSSVDRRYIWNVHLHTFIIIEYKLNANPSNGRKILIYWHLIFNEHQYLMTSTRGLKYQSSETAGSYLHLALFSILGHKEMENWGLFLLQDLI